MKTKPMTHLALITALLAAGAIASSRQGDVQAQATDSSTRCSTGHGANALTIALPAGSANHINGVYVRRAGCSDWSKNLGVVRPGKSIHILNLDDGALEVFWREHPHTYGAIPTPVDAPPTEAEWTTQTTSRTVSLSGETHRRIVAGGDAGATYAAAASRGTRQ